MDFLENVSMSGRTVKLIYYGHILLIVLLAMFLLMFVIIELSKEKSQEMSIPASTYTFHIPDMNEILLWGHNGRAVKVNVSKLYPGHRREYEEGYKLYDMNKYLSDRISLRRHLPDVRSQECLRMSRDLRKLPGVSVIVVFRNEPRTTLLRMLYSIIDRSPKDVVQDIILVDDNSDVGELQYPQLEHYLSGLKKVSIIRLPTNRGTAAARVLGAQAASGDVLIFLQPRSECTEGWMEPLVTGIHVDSSTITVPVVDRIDQDTFEYIQEPMNVGSFTWNLTTRKRSVIKPFGDVTAHIPNPVIADGIFAVNRENLFKLGGFDERLIQEDIVNIEFSFRAWMCGSRIILVPCSHVGYIFPAADVQRPGLLSNDTDNDKVRIAENWMGSYRHFVYERMQQDLLEDTQPLSRSRVQQRVAGPVTNASCWNFDWYLKMVEPDMYITRDIVRRGQVTMLGASDRILSIGVADGRVVVQDWISSPVTFWYHLTTGALMTENKQCLSYTPDTLITDTRHQGPLSSYLKLTKKLQDSNQSQNHVDADVRHKQSTSGPAESAIHQTTAFEGNQFLDLSHQSSYKQLLESQVQEEHPMQYGPHRKVRQVPSNDIHTHQENNMQQMDITSPESQIKRQSNLQDRNVTRPLSIVLLSKVKLQSHVQPGILTFTQEPQTVSLNDLVIKPCGQDGDGDEWIYTESKTLQHVKSGMCMEAHKSRTGQFFLRMVQCDNNSWVQRWRFISRLSD